MEYDESQEFNGEAIGRIRGYLRDRRRRKVFAEPLTQVMTYFVEEVMKEKEWQSMDLSRQMIPEGMPLLGLDFARYERRKHSYDARIRAYRKAVGVATEGFSDVSPHTRLFALTDDDRYSVLSQVLTIESHLAKGHYDMFTVRRKVNRLNEEYNVSLPNEDEYVKMETFAYVQYIVTLFDNVDLIKETREAQQFNRKRIETYMLSYFKENETSSD